MKGRRIGGSDEVAGLLYAAAARPPSEIEIAVEVGNAEVEELGLAVWPHDLDRAAPGIDDVAVLGGTESIEDEHRLGGVAQRLVRPAQRAARFVDGLRHAAIAPGGSGPDHVDGRNRREVFGQVGQQLADAGRIGRVVYGIPGPRGLERHRPVTGLMQLDAPAAAVDDELCSHHLIRMVR
jgi:hypothetical protein